MEYLVAFMQQLATVEMIIALSVGILGGMIIGVLPGLGAAMAIALLIPVTYGMEAIPALTMLTSVYAAATYGGSISAILLRTPGTLANVATAIEGYELTKKGRGLEAIGWATVASAIGGVAGGFALLIIAPPLARLALRFSSPEYFLLALVGLTLIGSLGGKSIARGLFSGGLGLLLALVGIENQTGFFRMTFGFRSLQTGISLVPALIGLFSISQIALSCEKLVNKGGLSKGQVVGKDQMSGRFLPSMKDIIKNIPLMTKTAVMGILVGILPGVGADIASWIGYDMSKRGSKNPELFGEGSMEGVIGPETAKSGVCGGSYIPLFTMGIPGSGTAAILLGGMLLHGLQPGPSLFTKNADITYPIIIAFIFANILTFFVGLVSAKQIARTASIPMNILAPFIAVMCVVGSYSINFSMFEVYMMLFFGICAYFMKKFSFPTAPVVLGIILGKMAEAGLNSSILMAKGNVLYYYASRPICWFFFILLVLAGITPILNKRKKARIANQEGTAA